jgi:hypothetical protein
MKVRGRVVCPTASGQVRLWASICALFVPASFHAAAVGKSEANRRQIALRARRQVEARKPGFEASRGRRKELARRFLEAVGQGDTEGLVGLLAADVVADGGGKPRRSCGRCTGASGSPGCYPGPLAR